MAKPKYSPETKLAVVNHYLSGKDGEQSTNERISLKLKGLSPVEYRTQALRAA
ncbi:IS3 family transposase [Klebsiella pneumoniae]|uniref:IS3 family transposase n=1 Tax=Klebsiella pneumoniae TaxID=573 RepID=UPI0039858D79